MPNKTTILPAVCLSLLALTGSSALAQSTDMNSEAMSGNGMQMGNGIQMPSFDAAKGRKLFGSKGCVVCHAINGVGGTDAPDISAAHMEKPMNAFDFAAKMWRGAPAMIAMQEDELGDQIELNGAELAAIIAFAHDPKEQAKFSEADVPEKFLKKLEAD